MSEKPAPSHMWTVSPAGYKALEQDEGFRNVAYRDVAGNLTIGFGHRIYQNGPTRITKEQGRSLLKADATKALHVMRATIRQRLWQCQVDALVRLVFNIGGAAFRSSHLLQAINRMDRPAIDREWLRWNHAGGKISQGLTNRRKSELEMFNEIEI